jgi:hypothetical protein
MALIPIPIRIGPGADHSARFALPAQLRQCWLAYHDLASEHNRYQLAPLERQCIDLQG